MIFKIWITQSLGWLPFARVHTAAAAHVCRRWWVAVSSKCVSLPCDTATAWATVQKRCGRLTLRALEEAHAILYPSWMVPVIWWQQLAGRWELAGDRVGRKCGKLTTLNETLIHPYLYEYVTERLLVDFSSLFILIYSIYSKKEKERKRMLAFCHEKKCISLSAAPVVTVVDSHHPHVLLSTQKSGQNEAFQTPYCAMTIHTHMH